MKILHAAALLRPSAGMLNQMADEQKAARELELEFDTRMFCPKGWVEPAETIEFSRRVRRREEDNRVTKLMDWVRLRADYYRWLSFLENTYDVFVLRYYVHDPFQLMFILRCKKPVYLVHHTREVSELAMKGLIGKFRAALEWMIGRAAIKGSTGIIGVTSEIIRYERERSGERYKPAILYPNGIMYEEKPVSDKRTDVPTLLFVASAFAEWHGLDVLLDAIAISTDEFILRLVGDLSVEDKQKVQKDPRIVVHGRKNQKEIRHIASSCWVGLSSFALYRQNMQEACTLKVREYLMMGIPVYAGYREVFPGNFKFYHNSVPNIGSILKFARAHRFTSREEVSLESRKFIDKVIIVQQFWDSLTVDCPEKCGS